MLHIDGLGRDLRNFGNILPGIRRFRAILCSICFAGAIQGQSNAQLEAVQRQRVAIEKQLGSLEKQKNSVRKQLSLAPAVPGSFFVTIDPGESNDCFALPIVRRQALVDSASLRTGVPADLLNAVIEQESGFRPCSVSSKGAMGLMQLMPGTANELGVADAFDPEQNVEGGARLLKKLLERYGGDLNRVLGAYNAGPAAVDQANGVPGFPETLNYVDGILGRLQRQD